MRQKPLNLALSVGLVMGLTALTLGMVSGLFVGRMGTALAGPEDPGQSSIYFPWVPNAATLGGIEEVNGSITVQNVEIFPVNVTIEDASGEELDSIKLNPRASQTFTAAGLGWAGGAGVMASAVYPDSSIDKLAAAGLCEAVEGYELYPFIIPVNRGAGPADVFNSSGSMFVTRVAQDVGGTVTVFVPGTDYRASVSNPGTPAAQIAIEWLAGGNEPTGGTNYQVTELFASSGGDTFDFLRRDSGNTDTQPIGTNLDIARVVVTLGGVTVPAEDYTWKYGGGNLAITWTGKGIVPAAGEIYQVSVLVNCPEPRIAGVAKTTVGTTGVRTNSNTEMVDGYSAVPHSDVLLSKTGGAGLEAQSRWILPIVQTNDGWNTEFVITNFGSKTANVNATFYAADGQGVGGTSEILVSQALKAGASVSFDLADNGMDEGTIGSVWIDADQDVAAVAFRVKDSTSMSLTNVAQPRYDLDGAQVKHAPLVFRDYNGWNTGINIANLSSNPNQVTVTLYNYSGNVVGTERVTISPRAMEYIYMPATGEIGLGENQISSAKIVGTGPLAAAVDEVKYLGGQGEGHAMSYLASTALQSRLIQKWGWQAAWNPFNRQYVDGRVHYGAALSLPLVQKGNERTGSGDTSGINLFNSNNTFGVQAHVQFLSSSGVPVAPTVAADDSESPIIFEMPAGAGATIYTLNYSEMPAGFQGSAVVGVVANVGLGEINLGSLVGVSNNVNYDVDGDGSAVFNLVNTYNYSFLDSVCRAIGTPVPGSPTPVPPFCLD